MFQSGNQTEHALLLAPLQLRLEADQAVVIAGDVVLAQLHHRVRLPSRVRIDEPDRLHRTEPQRVRSPMGHHFDRETAFEELLLVEVVHGRGFRVDDRVMEALVFLASHWTVQVVAPAVVHTACRARRRVHLRVHRRVHLKVETTYGLRVFVRSVRLQADRVSIPA